MGTEETQQPITEPDRKFEGISRETLDWAERNGIGKPKAPAESKKFIATALVVAGTIALSVFFVTTGNVPALTVMPYSFAALISAGTGYQLSEGVVDAVRSKGVNLLMQALIKGVAGDGEEKK